MAKADDFDTLYQSRYGDVVAMVHALVGRDLAEAQDLAQEAFCRAWQRWHRISAYDDPLSWIRRVAANLAMSRWRRLLAARRHSVTEPVGVVPGLEPDHVLLVAALRRLPERQRHAIVLHYVLDLPVATVAHELNTPLNTVKSLLHRGRQALSADLSIDLEVTRP